MKELLGSLFWRYFPWVHCKEEEGGAGRKAAANQENQGQLSSSFRSQTPYAPFFHLIAQFSLILLTKSVSILQRNALLWTRKPDWKTSRRSSVRTRDGRNVTMQIRSSCLKTACRVQQPPPSRVVAVKNRKSVIVCLTCGLQTWGVKRKKRTEREKARCWRLSPSTSPPIWSVFRFHFNGAIRYLMATSWLGPETHWRNAEDKIKQEFAECVLLLSHAA